jgi:sugar lactone lactonase YvrE
VIANRVTTRSVWHGGVAAVAGAVVLAGCSRSPSAGDLSGSDFFEAAQVWGARGRGAGQFNKPRSLTVDAQDNVFVVDMTGRVQKYNRHGDYLLFWQMPETDLGRAKGMALDREGHVIVIEPHYSRVNHFATDGQLVHQWGQHGTNTGQMMMPRAAAVDSLGEIWICEYGATERIQRFATDGAELLVSFGRFGTRPGELNRAEGLCVDAEDRLYVADSCNHRIQVFDRDGHWLRSYGRAGTGRGELSYPYDIRVDGAGNQYVCEFGNSRIQVFDAQDNPLEIVGGPGAAPGQFSNPWSIALDSAGNLYIADAGNHRVQKLLRRHPRARQTTEVGGRKTEDGRQRAEDALQAADPASRITTH